jgi:hypothetical protein
MTTSRRTSRGPVFVIDARARYRAEAQRLRNTDVVRIVMEEKRCTSSNGECRIFLLTRVAKSILFEEKGVRESKGAAAPKPTTSEAQHVMS